MLAIIDMIDRGLVSNNQFPISPELVGLFNGNWNHLVRSGHTLNFALPFFHLKNESSNVWNLKTLKGFDNVLTSSNSIKSLSSLKKYVLYGELAHDFYQYLIIDENRKAARNEIIGRYFPNIASSSSIRSYDYIENINSQILNDDPANYRRRIQELLNRSKEEVESESFVRAGAFKKQIPILYNNTCAITGLKVETSINASMIDACHIVPWAESHNDTVTNGISLCPNMHRAFDRGLISIDDSYKIILSEAFVEADSPFNISQFRNQKLILPAEDRFRPYLSNLEWHRQRWGFV
ncbi:MAG: HNH endonuclease [Cyclobacteriaceae bacterium]